MNNSNDNDSGNDDDDNDKVINKKEFVLLGNDV